MATVAADKPIYNVDDDALRDVDNDYYVLLSLFGCFKS